MACAILIFQHGDTSWGYASSQKHDQAATCEAGSLSTRPCRYGRRKSYASSVKQEEDRHHRRDDKGKQRHPPPAPVVAESIIGQSVALRQHNGRCLVWCSAHGSGGPTKDECGHNVRHEGGSHRSLQRTYLDCRECRPVDRSENGIELRKRATCSQIDALVGIKLRQPSAHALRGRAVVASLNNFIKTIIDDL
jgi:hypothetical protein